MSPALTTLDARHVVIGRFQITQQTFHHIFIGQLGFFFINTHQASAESRIDAFGLEFSLDRPVLFWHKGINFALALNHQAQGQVSGPLSLPGLASLCH